MPSPAIATVRPWPFKTLDDFAFLRREDVGFDSSIPRARATIRAFVRVVPRQHHQAHALGVQGANGIPRCFADGNPRSR